MASVDVRRRLEVVSATARARSTGSTSGSWTASSWCSSARPGCGKTTALRMVAGLEDISDGVVRIGDRVVNDLSPKSRDIAMVFQSYALYPHLSVRDNIAFPLKIAKVPKSEIRAPCRRGGADPRPGAVSQAEAACSIGRAAPASRDGPRDRPPARGVPDGRAVVEPRREAARADARRHQEDPGKSRRDDDLRHARPGRGDDDGRPRRGHAQGRAAAGRAAAGAVRPPGQHLRRWLHRQPRDEHARGACREAQRSALPPSVGEARLDLDEHSRLAAAYEGRSVVLGIRPEDLEDAAIAGCDGGARLRGRVELREALGSEVLVHFTVAARQAVTEDVRELAEDVGDDRVVGQLAGGEQPASATLVGRFSPRTRVVEGDVVEVCGRPATRCTSSTRRPGSRYAEREARNPLGPERVAG